MKNVMAILNLNENEENLYDLTKHRPVAAIPFGGRYRLIDFTLSNLVNSGIINVGILMPEKFGPLIDHIRSGKEWDLDRQQEGLFILPAADGNAKRRGQLSRDLENFHANINYLRNCHQEYVVISPAGMVCNIDYRKAFMAHLEKDAEITVLYKNVGREYPLEGALTLAVDQRGRVTDMAYNARETHNDCLAMEMYIMKRSLLVEIVDNCIARGQTNLAMDGILRNLDNYRVYGYEHEGYIGRIDSVYSYYKHNMDILLPAVRNDLYFANGLVYTKTRSEAPAKYASSAKVINSVIANGCHIEGTVENSVLFRGVHVARGAVVRNSILMQKVRVEENAYVDRVIFDKNVRITTGRSMKGESNMPIVIEKNYII